MLASESSREEVMVEVFGGDESDEEFGMPFFEMSQSTVRPTAPPEEDYPVGCEVELRDVEFAREVHRGGEWGITFDLLFAVPRRSVTVRRHAGDFTFVVCRTVQGYEQVGVTLYRACLGELTVRANTFMDESIIREDMEQSEKATTSLTALLGHRSPSFARGSAEAFHNTLDGPSSPRLETVLRAGHTRVSNSGDLDAPTRDAPGPPTAETTTATKESGACRRTSSSAVQEVRTRRQFNDAMAEGTMYFNKKEYHKALECYSRAMNIEVAERARALCSKSACHLMLGNSRAALNDAFDAIRADRNDFNGYVRAANVFSSAKKFDKAHTFYVHALKLKRDDRRICSLFVTNFASKLYTGLTANMPFKMVYQRNCLQAVAKRAIAAEKEIMREETALCCPLTRWTLPNTCAHEFPACTRCGKHYMRWDDVRAALPSISHYMYNTVCRPVEPVPCKANCGSYYCSESCRDKAWQLYHFLECPITGKWREGISKLDEFLLETVQNESVGAKQQQQKPLLSNTVLTATESLSAVSIVTCVRIAVRMLCTLEGSTVTTNDSVHRFDFMSVDPEVEKQRRHVGPFLEECYKLLAPHFVLQERDRLQLKFFVDCYERAKSNAVFITTTPWSRFSGEVRNLNNFLSLTSSGDPDMPVGHAGLMKADTKGEIYDILHMPESGPAGLQTTWLCLFELATPIMAYSEKLYSRNRGRRQPNVAVRTTVEPTVCVHLDSLCSIAVKDPLIVARLTRLECAS